MTKYIANISRPIDFGLHDKMKVFNDIREVKALTLEAEDLKAAKKHIEDLIKNLAESWDIDFVMATDMSDCLSI